MYNDVGGAVCVGGDDGGLIGGGGRLPPVCQWPWITVPLFFTRISSNMWVGTST